jgi:hypothetical protein
MDAEPILSSKVAEDREVDMSQLRTLTAYVGFSHQGAQDYAFLGLPVYQDKPLPLIWEPAETLKFPTFCVYKMNASETIVIFKRSQKSPEHLVNIRRDHRQYAVDLASSLTSHEIQEVRAREAEKESAGDTDCLDH